jgi:hypothetical protein
MVYSTVDRSCGLCDVVNIVKAKKDVCPERSGESKPAAKSQTNMATEPKLTAKSAATFTAKKATHQTVADTKAAVDAFIAGLDHPFKKEISLLRAAVLAADPTIEEGVKWNAPSFRTTEYFATIHLRSKIGIGLVLHLGAKMKDVPPEGLVIDDPAASLKWLGKDRALVEFASAEELAAKIPALQALLQQWLRYV